MAMHLLEDGKIDISTEVTSRDLTFVIGACSCRRSKDDVTQAELVEAIADNAMKDPEYYYTPFGLDEAAVATELLCRRMKIMKAEALNGVPYYLAGGIAFLDESALFLEALRDKKPIINEAADNDFLYADQDPEFVDNNMRRGITFIDNLKTHIDRKRGLFMEQNGKLRNVPERKPERKKNFLQNLFSMMNPFGKKPKKDRGPWYEM